MERNAPVNEYLVISRGQWDADAAPERIQAAIDAFYDWHDQEVASGRMRTGSRLGRDTRLVTRSGVLDGPFSETKEIVGGYWYVLAASLDEAARIAAGNPCLAFGLSYEIRALEAERASAFATTAETPPAARTGRAFDDEG